MVLAVNTLGRDRDCDCAARLYFKIVLCTTTCPLPCTVYESWGTIRVVQICIHLDRSGIIMQLALTVVNLHSTSSVIN